MFEIVDKILAFIGVEKKYIRILLTVGLSFTIAIPVVSGFIFLRQSITQITELKAENKQLQSEINAAKIERKILTKNMEIGEDKFNAAVRVFKIYVNNSCSCSDTEMLNEMAEILTDKSD